MGKNMKRKRESGGDRAKLSRLKTGGMAAALVAAAAVFVILVQTEKAALTQYEKGSIFAASTGIPKGQMITQENFSEYFIKKELDKSCIPDTALSSQEEVSGLCAVADIDEGVLLTKGMFEPLEETVRGMEEPVVAGFKAEDIWQLAGGILRSGDRIHIYTVSESGEAVLCWENVFIERVFDQSGSLIRNEDRTTAAQRVNVYLDKDDIEAFYTNLANGALRVVKVY